MSGSDGSFDPCATFCSRQNLGIMPTRLLKVIFLAFQNDKNLGFLLIQLKVMIIYDYFFTAV